MVAVVASAEDLVPRGGRVLVADDDEQLCRHLAAALAAAGHQVVAANDGADALAVARSSPPDVAIVDLTMPTSGLDVVRQLKEMHGSALHVMVMTGYDDEDRRVLAFSAGADDFVAKPIAVTELRRRVAAALRTQHDFVELRLAKEVADRRMTYGVEASAMLAHDLNNSLAVSLSNLQYLSEEVALDGDHRDALLSTLRALRRMSGLVANFVDIGRFEDAAVKPLVEHVLVRELLASVLEVNVDAAKQGVAFRIDCDPALEARFDSALVERVLHNLVGNASRYCNAGGEVTLCARADKGAGSCALVVTNTGPQVPEPIREQLFEKYARGREGKRGMGLYFCRLVAEAHGGTLAYEATPTGPSFVVRLPGRA